MILRLFTLASACSLLFCLLSLSLWIPSYWRGESLDFTRRAGDGTLISYGLGSESGAVVLIIIRLTGADSNRIFDRWAVFGTFKRDIQTGRSRY